MERPGEHGGLGLGPRDSGEGCWAGASVYPCEPQGLCGWWVKVGRGSLAMAPSLTGFYPCPSCVCKEGEVGDGRACYGHLLHEVQKASQTSMLLRLRVTFAMLGA